MKPKLKHVSEEIVRWAFEVKVQKDNVWKIAFTNPTAGPWKRVLGENDLGKTGEIHRFEIDEKRPDLILFSDKFRTVLIIEAKTDFSGLSDINQVEKTAALFLRLRNLLQGKSGNLFWGQRAHYRYELGLLWGKGSEIASDVSDTVNNYIKEAKFEIQDVLCIQGVLTNEQLSHEMFWGKSNQQTSLNNYQS